jgi:hypothetical protein
MDPAALRTKVEALRDQLWEQLSAAEHLNPGLLTMLANIQVVLPAIIEMADKQQADEDQARQRRVKPGDRDAPPGEWKPAVEEAADDNLGW